jgi:Phosphate-selective porin O and P
VLTHRRLLYGLVGIFTLGIVVLAKQSIAADMDKPTAIPSAEEILPQPRTEVRASPGMSAPLASTPLEDILLQKGLITQDEWLRIKAEEERKSYEHVTESQYRSSPRWFERINVNGYFQFRYGMKSDSKLQLTQGDGNLTNNNQDFYFRRIRMVFQGQMSDRISFFLQAAHEGNGFRLQELELVDAYGDYFITKDKEHRLRFGLHRVPNSFDTYRSSSQRQELDRSEVIQSGAPGERDLGLAYYWSPKIAQDRYAQLATYHNGPGDYGVFGIMVYNGQGRSQTEANHNKHVGAKVAYPFELPNGRLLEAGVLGFLGEYVVTSSGSTTVGTSATSVSRCPQNLRNGGCAVDEERVTGYIWTPPQPWGIMAEYTIGTGPERNSAGIIERQSLHGGYVQGNYTWRYSDVGMLTPYVRYSYYKGGFKNQGAAAANNIMYNVGLVWEPDTHLRLVTEYLWTDQLNISEMKAGLPQEYVAGQMLRFQMQWFFN